MTTAVEYVEDDISPEEVISIHEEWRMDFVGLTIMFMLALALATGLGAALIGLMQTAGVVPDPVVSAIEKGCLK